VARSPLRPAHRGGTRSPSWAGHLLNASIPSCLVSSTGIALYISFANKPPLRLSGPALLRRPTHVLITTGPVRLAGCSVPAGRQPLAPVRPLLTAGLLARGHDTVGAFTSGITYDHATWRASRSRTRWMMPSPSLSNPLGPTPAPFNTLLPLLARDFPSRVAARMFWFAIRALGRGHQSVRSWLRSIAIGCPQRHCLAVISARAAGPRSPSMSAPGPA